MRRQVLALGASIAAVAGSIALAAPASATDYTHATTLTRASCTIHANYPKPGVPDWGWTKAQTAPSGAAYHVGVRYTINGYALVLDYAKGGEPSWGFIAKSCLSDPNAYSSSGQPLGDLQAPGGDGNTKAVPFQPPHSGGSVSTIHVASGAVGTLRSAARSFVIGNVRSGEELRITSAHCGTHSPEAWILGYAPASGRWGYVQAKHLPACV